MANVKYFTVIFSDTNLTADNELVLPSLLPIATALRCYVTYNVTPAIETQDLAVQKTGSYEAKVSLSDKVVGSGHKAILTYI